MLTFGITTTTKLASLSIIENEKILGEIKIEVYKTHSITILEQIDKLFLWSGKKLEDVENVIVSMGPGSFTGIRIAIAVVKGLFYGKDVRIYSVNELDALAYQSLFLERNSIKSKDIIYSIIDSGKEKIYYGKYQVVNNEKLKSLQENKVGKLSEILNEISLKNIENFAVQNRIYLIGDGIFNYRKKLEDELCKIDNSLENGMGYIKFIDENNLKINASTFYRMLRNNLLKEENIFTLKPDYLEKSQAERDKKNGV